MKNPKKPKISDAELEILGVLWSKREATISEIHGALNKPVQQATIQTQLNRLIEKKVVKRDDRRPARYSAILEPEIVSSRPLELLVKNIGNGSVFPLIAHLVKHQEFTADEIALLKQLVKGLQASGFGLQDSHGQTLPKA